MTSSTSKRATKRSTSKRSRRTPLGRSTPLGHRYARRCGLLRVERAHSAEYPAHGAHRLPHGRGRRGGELIAQLQARWPGVPCLFMSGFMGDISLGPGFDPRKDLVAKPFTPSELLEHIARKL